MIDTILQLWHWSILGLSLIFSVAAGSHAVLWKRNSRAAFGWLVVILIIPLLGSILYWVFGINRIYRKAEALYRHHDKDDSLHFVASIDKIVPGLAIRGIDPDRPQMSELAVFVARVTGEPLYRGNRVDVLETGGLAYAAMLEAIDSARESVLLQTYIFDADRAGERFRRALTRARDRGVRVRVLIDAVGDRYSSPPMHRILEEDGLEVAVFLPTRWPRHMAYANLRNHRKLLVVDGSVAFTGGMNIRQGHVIEEEPEYPVHDLHFRLEGPIVSALASTFADDWGFMTNEDLVAEGIIVERRFRKDRFPGTVLARAIDDGPAQRFGTLRWTFLGALACAKERVRIATPYFLPDEGLITALAMASKRGVSVEILIPEKNNLLLVQWASTARLWQVLEPGCEVFLVPPPFDHTKLMVVDDAWSLIGSANWDPRSFRLNFELDVECYCPHLAADANRILDQKLERSRRITLAEVDARPLPIRFRDGLARLFTPYL